MSHIERIDHKAQALELMLSQFENSPNKTALLLSWLSPIQQMEDDLHAFMEGSGVDDGEGRVLDIIGSWMGVERQGRLDSDYRTAILGRAITEGMDGTTEKFYEGFRVLINSNQAHCFTYYPNDLYAVAGEGFNSSTASELKRIVQAGTNVNLYVAPGLEYWVPAIRGAEDDTLRTHEDEIYEVVIDGITYPLQTTVVTSAETYGTTTTFGWQGVDLPNAKPFAFKVTDFQIVQGTVIDQDGNVVVDHEGNEITYLEPLVI